jgi:hypothetical protein
MDLHDADVALDQLWIPGVWVDRLHGAEVLSALWRDCGEPPVEERELAACRRLGLRLSEWAATLIEGRKEAHPLNQTYDRFGYLASE